MSCFITKNIYSQNDIPKIELISPWLFEQCNILMLTASSISSFSWASLLSSSPFQNSTSPTRSCSFTSTSVCSLSTRIFASWNFIFQSKKNGDGIFWTSIKDFASSSSRSAASRSDSALNFFKVLCKRQKSKNTVLVQMKTIPRAPKLIILKIMNLRNKEVHNPNFCFVIQIICNGFVRSEMTAHPPHSDFSRNSSTFDITVFPKFT